MGRPSPVFGNVADQLLVESQEVLGSGRLGAIDVEGIKELILVLLRLLIYPNRDL
jgi:hypothetical protein